ncbi:MAG: TetR/AcrR family transcriptional regulator [Motiliproteus sp.]
MSTKRIHLITTAFNLFYQKGVHAVGINEILAESGVAKKTLYHHFDSKDELVSAVLAYRDRCFCHWLEEKLDTTAPGMAKIDALFDALDDWFNDRVATLLPFHGCFFINVSAEFGDPAHPLHQQCSQHKKSIAALIETQVQTLNIESNLIAAVTDALCLLKEGAITLAHVQGDRSAALKAKQTAHLLISGCV